MTSQSPRQNARNEILAQWTSRYQRGLTHYFYQRTRDWAEAEDLTQELLLRSIRAVETAKIDNAEAFLYHAAGNLLKDRLRRKYTARAYLDAVGPVASARTDDMTPERRLEARQALENALKALDGEEARVREAFLLHRLQGLKHPDIAARLGVSVSSVEKYIVRCLAVLAAHLAQQREQS